MIVRVGSSCVLANMDKKRKDKESKLVKTLHRDMDEAVRMATPRRHSRLI